MSLEPRRHPFPNGCVDLMPRPWYVDVLTAAIVFAWMGWTFTTIQQFGPSLDLLVPALIVGVAGVLLLYGQRMTYLRIGQFELGMDSPLTNGPDESDETDDPERERYR